MSSAAVHTAEIFKRVNNAIVQNPNVADIDLSERGSDWLWAVFAVMLFADLLMFSWMFTVPVGQRVFHQMSIVILTTASIAYFSMASDLGAAAIVVEYVRGYGLGAGMVNPTRSIWYVRYIDWVITTPLLLLELLLATGLPLSEIFTVIYFDLVMIIAGLVGALVASQYKWGYFAGGNVALVYVVYVLLGPARASANRLGPQYGRAYLTSAGFLSFLWILYPIAWGLCDGGNVIYVDSEMIFYGILDLLAKPVYCFLHVYALSKVDQSALMLQSGKYSESAPAQKRFAPNTEVGL